MNILSVVGARPQFIKAAMVSRVLRRQHTEVLVHTGQHYDKTMSDVFFEELNIPEPAYNLGIGSASHGAQTGAMLAAIEEVLLAEQPDALIVYGDTNSTLAGALAAAKLHIPIAHVEAGLRSFNISMPEEINRLLTDHISKWLFCPTKKAQTNLHEEGIKTGIWLVGDVMVDALQENLPIALARSDIQQRLGLETNGYYLATLHRAYNTDNPRRLGSILYALSELSLPVILPAHPRTAKAIEAADLKVSSNVRSIPPVSYLDMLTLEANASRILTDSGGVQKEAYLIGIPCITLREETEWEETLVEGWNQLAGADPDAILSAVSRPIPVEPRPPLFGDGKASQHIVSILSNECCD